MTEIKVVREDEKATAILRAIRQIDEGAELVPVVRGRWLGEAGDWECSCCGNYGFDGGWETSDFCPNCGADMRGAENG